MSISATIKSVQDIMRQDAGVDGDAQRISQLVWMLFLKVFDSKEKEWDALSDDYTYIIPDGLRWSDWAEDDEGITGDELIDFVNNTLFKTFKDWQLTEASNPKAVLVKSLFEDSYNYMKSGTLMRSVINKLNEIDFDKASDRHLFNDIYENILKDLQSAGNSGEYYTPRPVTQFMVDMVNPQLGEQVLDFACGTGLVTLPVAQMAAEVCAIDISDEMVRHLKEKIAEQGVGNVSVSCMDLFDDSLRPDSFDAVVACNVLLYLENRAEVLTRIHELLRPEGVFLSATDCLGERLTREGVRKWWRSHTGKMPYVSFDRMHTLEASIAAAGFEVLETENLFPAPPNLFVAARKK